MALEIKSTKDDVIRGIGQCTEALAGGCQSAALVTSVQRAKRIKPDVFHEHLVLLGIDAKGMVHQVYP
jgi:CII-binding regulator of phage lambda lysogenization HflD